MATDGRSGNLRDATYTTSSGKDVKDTDMLKGEASEKKDMKSSNSTSQYETGKSSMGALGGKNTNS